MSLALHVAMQVEEIAVLWLLRGAPQVLTMHEFCSDEEACYIITGTPAARSQ